MRLADLFSLSRPPWRLSRHFSHSFLTIKLRRNPCPAASARHILHRKSLIPAGGRFFLRRKNFEKLCCL